VSSTLQPQDGSQEQEKEQVQVEGQVAELQQVQAQCVFEQVP